MKHLLTSNSIAQHVAKGYGTGKGASYKPWLEIRHVSSSGKSTRVQGWHTKRMHSFLSDLEYNFFLLLEWDDDILDIQEQFPLFPQEEINEICDALAVRIPRLPKATVEMVRTTDFLVTSKIGKEAWSIKPARQLENKRVLEKLDIERAYWERRGIPFSVITENEIETIPAKNIRWFHGNRTNDTPSDLLRKIRGVLESVIPTSILGEACREADELLGLTAGSSMSAVKHFIASKKWKVNIAKEISPQKPLALL